MSEYYASPEDYDWMVRTLGKKKADEMVRRDNMQIRPNEVEFTPISGVGGMDEEYEDEETLGGLTAAEQGDEMALDYRNPLDVARAIQRSSLEQKAYYDALAEQLKAKRYGPTASERLFALSAAFAAPTSTRGFGGMMGNVMPVFQQFEKSKRDAEEARAADMQKLQMARMGATQAEINSALALQKLQAQYNKPKPKGSRPRAVVGPDERTRHSFYASEITPPPRAEMYKLQSFLKDPNVTDQQREEARANFDGAYGVGAAEIYGGEE